jgi:hypothetical protein
MRGLIAEMNRHKNRDLAKAKADGLATAGIKCDPALLASFEARYDALIERGRAEHAKMREKELGQSEFNAMLNRLTDYKDSYLLFMRDYRAPFTNNLAEQDLRVERQRKKCPSCSEAGTAS